MNEMVESTFNWNLQYGTEKDQKKNRYVNNYKINTDWKLTCFWNGTPRLEFLEVSRNKTAGDILVSGSFKLMNNQSCLLQRKFIQLIEDGSATTRVELEYSGHYYGHHYTLIGTLSIPASVVHKECLKEVSFKSLLELSKEFERLLDPKATYFTDMNLKCGNVSFPVHKSILSVRSSVFAAMFSNDMREKQENKVVISDIRSDVLKTMLNYIYSGKTGELSVQSAGELLFAADKYQLLDLKRVCSDHLKSCVSVVNVLKLLVLGHLHDDDLQIFAMDFICNSCEEFEVLEKTEEWRNLRKERPSLAMDVLTRVIKSKDEKLKGKKINH